MTTPDQHTEWAKLAEAATPGPWVTPPTAAHAVVARDGDGYWTDVADRIESEADARFIAAAAALRALRRIVDLASARDAEPTVKAAHQKAAAAGGAAGGAARTTAWVTAGYAPGVAARVAAGVAARVASYAARAGAGGALSSTVATLRDSTLDLLDRMIALGEEDR